MQNEDKRIHFWEPESVKEGDIVWVYDINTLVGPYIVDHYGLTGYGSNKKLMYKLLDTSTGSWFTSEKKWIRVPMEIE